MESHNTNTLNNSSFPPVTVFSLRPDFKSTQTFSILLRRSGETAGHDKTKIPASSRKSRTTLEQYYRTNCFEWVVPELTNNLRVRLYICHTGTTRPWHVCFNVTCSLLFLISISTVRLVTPNVSAISAGLLPARICRQAYDFVLQW